MNQNEFEIKVHFAPNKGYTMKELINRAVSAFELTAPVLHYEIVDVECVEITGGQSITFKIKYLNKGDGRSTSDD